MRFNEIKQMAKEMEINTYRMNKADIIRAIQRAENNIDCFGTSRVQFCQEQACLWRTDCISQNGNSIKN